MLRDDMGLWTDNPDPYPWIQFGEKFAATVYGTNKGYKAGEKLLTKKNVQKLNNLFKDLGFPRSFFYFKPNVLAYRK